MPPSTTPGIIFVDDDRQLLDSLRNRLQRLRTGWDMRFHDNAQAAMSDLDTAGSEGAVLITDWMMPGTDGLSLCQQFASASHDKASDTPHYYVILMTGRQGIENIEAALNGGADDFIAKPFDTRELVARIRVGIRTCRLENNLRIANLHLARQAITDPLTGLLNRRRALEILSTELERGLRGTQSLAVAMADIDYFKNVNDSLGHEAGDRVLKVIAQRLQAVARRYDAVVRWGGEEFLLICPHAGQNEIRRIAERLRAGVSASPIETQPGNAPLSITLSIGTAVVAPGAKITADAIVASADQALYAAKHAGRNRVRSAALSQC
ncbi:MAG: diguanylate cyclase [Gammaproteobacteria bacterium]|nr:diguanylate cyclase [Gammaproteobacteria bacterium]